MNELTQLPPELTSGSKETLAPLRQWPSSSHVFDEDSICLLYTSDAADE